MAILDLLNEVEEIIDDDVVNKMIITKTDKKDKEPKKSKFFDDFEDDDFSNTKIRKTKKKGINIDEWGFCKKKKKKKKGKKKNKYKEELMPELIQLKEVYVEQSHFVDNLQSTYNDSQKNKSNVRGSSKYTTDLITNIITGRKLKADLLKDIVNIKKTAADLDMKFATIKNKEESDSNGGNDNIFRQIIESGRNIDMSVNDMTIPEIEDMNDDFIDLDDDMKNKLKSTVKFEKMNAKVILMYNEDTGDKYFKAISGNDGSDIPDYDLPEMSDNLTLNMDTMLASDPYGEKYKIVLINDDVEDTSETQSIDEIDSITDEDLMNVIGI
jgi:hypothetical protein